MRVMASEPTLQAGLAGALGGAGPFTVFAPDDDAFNAACKKLGVTKLALMDLPNLGDVLKAHVVAGAVLSSDLKEGQVVETLGGKKVTITLAGGAKVNGIKIKKADVKAANGIIHAITGAPCQACRSASPPHSLARRTEVIL